VLRAEVGGHLRHSPELDDGVHHGRLYRRLQGRLDLVPSLGHAAEDDLSRLEPHPPDRPGLAAGVDLGVDAGAAALSRNQRLEPALLA